MRFEISERVNTDVDREELLATLEEQFRKVSEGVQRSGQVLEANGIEATFGSISRSDTTTISLKGIDDGWLLVADVHYRPSVAFWIILVLTLFTYVLWLIPIAFYFLQKDTVKAAIIQCFHRVRNEFDRPLGGGSRHSSLSLEDLERLGVLRDKGLLTEAEFEAKKRDILGL